MKRIIISCIVLTFAGLLMMLLPGKSNVKMPERIGRIVSLSPSITREITDLGAKSLIVGVTSFDDIKDISATGSLMSPDLEKILSLKPDCVFFSSEDNNIQDTERLLSTGIPAYTFAKNKDFASIEKNFKQLAKMLEKENIAHEKMSGYKAALKSVTANPTKPRVAFLLSTSPLILVTQKSLIGRMIIDAGGNAVIADSRISYPIISLEIIVRQNPDIIIGLYPDDGNSIRGLFREFGNLTAIKNNNIYCMNPDHVCYYSPADYVNAVKELNHIFKRSQKL